MLPPTCTKENGHSAHVGPITAGFFDTFPQMFFGMLPHLVYTGPSRAGFFDTFPSNDTNERPEALLNHRASQRMSLVLDHGEGKNVTRP